MGNMASAYQDAGKLDASLSLFEKTLNSQKAKLGPEHPDTLKTMYHLALAYEDAGKLDESAALFKETLTLCKRTLGARHPVTETTLSGLGGCLLRQTNSAAAEAVLREELELRQGSTHSDWRTFKAQSQLGTALLGQKRFVEAEPLLLEGFNGMEEQEKKIPAGARNSLKAAGEQLVLLYQVWGKMEQASEWRRKLDQHFPHSREN
jgi:tetratricopeptide (TPR) repeat protein